MKPEENLTILRKNVEKQKALYAHYDELMRELGRVREELLVLDKDIAGDVGNMFTNEDFLGKKYIFASPGKGQEMKSVNVISEKSGICDRNGVILPYYNFRQFFQKEQMKNFVSYYYPELDFGGNFFEKEFYLVLGSVNEDLECFEGIQDFRKSLFCFFVIAM